MNLPQHIIDEADAFTASQAFWGWFIGRHDIQPAPFDFFVAGAAWQKARSDMDKQPSQPTVLEILQRNLDLCEKRGNKSEVVVLTKEQLETLVMIMKSAPVSMKVQYSASVME